MPEIQFLNNETEIAASIRYPDDSKTELSFFKETKELSLAQYSDASADIPDEQYTMQLLELQTLVKLLASAEIPPEVAA